MIPGNVTMLWTLILTQRAMLGVRSHLQEKTNGIEFSLQLPLSGSREGLEITYIFSACITVIRCSVFPTIIASRALTFYPQVQLSHFMPWFPEPLTTASYLCSSFPAAYPSTSRAYRLRGDDVQDLFITDY
jgi:hypothetical protein